MRWKHKFSQPYLLLCDTKINKFLLIFSLINMYKELETDIEGFKAPKHGHLIGWARQGSILYNFGNLLSKSLKMHWIIIVKSIKLIKFWILYFRRSAFECCFDS